MPKKLPLEAAVYLLQQRTNLLEKVEELYLKSCQGDASLIATHIMPHDSPIRTAVDIGCGLGGVSVELARHFPNAKFIMLDRNGNDGRKVNYGENFGKYNQLELTGQYLKALKIKHSLCDIDKDQPPVKVDLAFSVISWGFHYPIDVHIEWVAKAARQLIIDCRADTGAKSSLEKHFSSVELIKMAHKHEWYSCVK